MLERYCCFMPATTPARRSVDAICRASESATMPTIILLVMSASSRHIAICRCVVDDDIVSALMLPLFRARRRWRRAIAYDMIRVAGVIRRQYAIAIIMELTRTILRQLVMMPYAIFTRRAIFRWRHADACYQMFSPPMRASIIRRFYAIHIVLFYAAICRQLPPTIAPDINEDGDQHRYAWRCFR